MKTLRIIQDTVAGAGLLVAVALADSMQMTTKELVGSVALVIVCMMHFVIQGVRKETKNI